GRQFTMRTERIGAATRTRAKAPAASDSALSPAPAAPVAPAENGGAATADAAAPASAIESQIGTQEVGVPQQLQEEAPPLPLVPVQPEVLSHPAPTPPPPQPSLIDIWQQASDDERTAFVARYRNDLRLLLTALDEQPKKRMRASQHTPRPQPQQKQRRRAAA